MAEEVGFEPTELSLNGFQDRRLQPLGHSSTKKSELRIKNEEVKNYYCCYVTSDSLILTPHSSLLTS